MSELHEVYLSPAQVAERWSVATSHVLSLVRQRKLKAIDVSSEPSKGKPRYRIAEAEVERFERIRLLQPVPTLRRRSKVRKPIKDYFANL